MFLPQDRTGDGGSLPKIVTWADGTDEEIAAMVNAHYDGIIDLNVYWAVGDERIVHLSAIEATEDLKGQSARDVTFVLMNKGGKTLVNSINGISECVFIVGLKTITVSDKMHTTNMSGIDYKWQECIRRAWCNSLFKNCIPNALRNIFKEHYNDTKYRNYSSDYFTTQDYFALASADEIQTDSNRIWKYYKTDSNRSKGSKYWTRNSNNYYQRFMFIDSRGSYNESGYDATDTTIGISPFGVI